MVAEILSSGAIKKIAAWIVASGALAIAARWVVRIFVGATDIDCGYNWSFDGTMNNPRNMRPNFDVRNRSGSRTYRMGNVTSDGSDGRPVGSYSFENVPSGAYIQVTLPPGTWTAENPPPGVSTNSNGSNGIVVGVTFTGGQSIDTIGFTDDSDNPYSVAIKSADLQNSGQENLVIRTSSALFVQRFQTDGTSVFDSYAVSSPAAFFRPQLYLEDLNANGRIDIVTSGQTGVDVFINIDLGEFRPFTGLLADKLNNSPNAHAVLRQSRLSRPLCVAVLTLAALRKKQDAHRENAEERDSWERQPRM